MFFVVFYLYFCVSFVRISKYKYIYIYSKITRLISHVNIYLQYVYLSNSIYLAIYLYMSTLQLIRSTFHLPPIADPSARPWKRRNAGRA